VKKKLLPLHQNRINLAAKNRQGNDPWRLAAKQNPLRIEGQGNSIYLADNFLGGLAAKQNR